MSFKTNLTGNGDTDTVRIQRDGSARLQAGGTWGAGTITPYKKNPASGVFEVYGSDTLTDDGSLIFQVFQGDEVKGTLSGATSPDLDCHWTIS